MDQVFHFPADHLAADFGFFVLGAATIVTLIVALACDLLLLPSLLVVIGWPLVAGQTALGLRSSLGGRHLAPEAFDEPKVAA